MTVSLCPEDVWKSKAQRPLMLAALGLAGMCLAALFREYAELHRWLGTRASSPVPEVAQSSSWVAYHLIETEIAERPAATSEDVCAKLKLAEILHEHDRSDEPVTREAINTALTFMEQRMAA